MLDCLLEEQLGCFPCQVRLWNWTSFQFEFHTATIQKGTHVSLERANLKTTQDEMKHLHLSMRKDSGDVGGNVLKHGLS
jgi:hypothetical protein